MEKDHLILTDPMVELNDSILEKVLGMKFKTFENFISKINKNNLKLEWNYYNDQKCW